MRLWVLEEPGANEFARATKACRNPACLTQCRCSHRTLQADVPAVLDCADARAVAARRKGNPWATRG